MLTAGAMAADYANYKLTEYPLLTRVGPNFTSLVQFLSSILYRFNWNIVKLVYNPSGQKNIVEKFCHIAVDGIHHGLKDSSKGNNFKVPYFKFDVTEELLRNMKVEFGVDVAGRSNQIIALLLLYLFRKFVY